MVCPGLFGVGNGHKNDIGAAHRFRRAHHFKSLGLRHGNGFASLIQADNNLAAAVFQVQGMGVALGAEAQNGQGFVLQVFQVGVFVGINFGRHKEW